MGGKARFVDDGRTCDPESEDSKQCGICQVWTPLSHFYKKKSGKHGVTANCKACSTTQRDEWKIQSVSQKACRRCHEVKPADCLLWRTLSKPARQAAHDVSGRLDCQKCGDNKPAEAFRVDSPTCCKECESKRQKGYRKEHPSWNIRGRVKRRMTNAFKQQNVAWIPGTDKQAAHVDNEVAEALLGRSFSDYKGYLEEGFKQYPGLLSWKNLEMMEIDHKIPITKFDISTTEGAQQAFNYKNTQPMPKVLHAVKTSIEDSAKASSACDGRIVNLSLVQKMVPGLEQLAKLMKEDPSSLFEPV